MKITKATAATGNSKKLFLTLSRINDIEVPKQLENEKIELQETL
jgi:hypothetical protein